jgi:adenosylcobinamide-GDP ribazoletransferase
MTPRRIADDIALCLVFFTRLPLPTFDFRGRTLAESIWAAPLVGVAVAVAASLVHALASAAGLSPEVAAALALGTATLTTGCLHEDGLSTVSAAGGRASKNSRSCVTAASALTARRRF